MIIEKINTEHNTYTMVKIIDNLMHGKIIHKYKGQLEMFRYLKWHDLIGMEKELFVKNKEILTDKVALVNYYL